MANWREKDIPWTQNARCVVVRRPLDLAGPTASAAVEGVIEHAVEIGEEVVVEEVDERHGEQSKVWSGRSSVVAGIRW